jgi:hypothetical protein
MYGNFYLTHYKSAFAFSAIPYLHPMQAFLAVCLPAVMQERYGLAMFYAGDNMNDSGSVYTPTVFLSV